MPPRKKVAVAASQPDSLPVQSVEVVSAEPLGAGEQIAPGIQADGSPTPTPTPPPPAAEVLARALRVLEHDGVRYGPGQAAGDELGMTYKAFDALASAGAVERINQE